MPRSRLRAALLIAASGAVLVLIDLFGDAGAFTGVGLMVLGAILSAPGAPKPGTGELNWWGLLAAGTGLCLVGVPLELALDTLGGLVAAGGAVLAVIAAALAFPD